MPPGIHPLVPPQSPPFRGRSWFGWSRIVWTFSPLRIHSATACASLAFKRESESLTINRSTVSSSATRNRQNMPAMAPLVVCDPFDISTNSAPNALSSLRIETGTSSL